MRNSHALAASYLLADDRKTSLADVEKAVRLEIFRNRINRYSFNIPVLKVLISIVLIVFTGMAIHQSDR